MNEKYLGSKFKKEKADQLGERLELFLSEGEYIKGFFVANNVIPLIDTIVTTNKRTLCLESVKMLNGDGVKKEFTGEKIQKATAEASKLSGNLVPLKATLNDNKEIKIASIKKEDTETLVNHILEMQGNPPSLPDSIKAYADNMNAQRDEEAEKKRQNEIAMKAAMIRAYERPEKEKTESDRKLLASTEGQEYIRRADEALVAKHEISNSSSHSNSTESGRCPKCGSNHLQAVQEVKTKGVDTLSSTAGCCCLGPIGLLCGLPGAGQSTTKIHRMCLNCGNKFK